MPGNSTYIFRHTLLATLGAVAALSGPALNVQAHFTLLEPESWIDENALGDPQKNGPCGGESGMPTGAVTTYQAGETITVRWRETIYHPGHWRIAIVGGCDTPADCSPTPGLCGDLDESGVIGATDALRLLQKAVGIDVGIKCPACPAQRGP